MSQPAGFGTLQTNPGKQPHVALRPVACGVTGPELVGFGQVRIPLMVTVLPGPEIVGPMAVTVVNCPGTVIVSPGIVIEDKPTAVTVVNCPGKVVISPGSVRRDVEVVVSVTGGIMRVVRDPDIDVVTVEAGSVVVAVISRVETRKSANKQHKDLGCILLVDVVA